MDIGSSSNASTTPSSSAQASLSTTANAGNHLHLGASTAGLAALFAAALAL